MILPLAVLAPLMLGAPDEIVIDALMGDGTIAPGAPHAFRVEFLVPEGMSAGEQGLSDPFLQLDLPEGLTLTEPPSDEEFISMPFERLLTGPSTEIPFEVDESLAVDATIGLVFTAYLSTDESARFLRRRLELPVSAGARAREGDARDSSWGEDTSLLNIGDRVEGFALPMAEGVEPFDLGLVIGKRPVFLTTYRAHW